jgi:transcriptional regulator GlxA family with amidase domain
MANQIAGGDRFELFRASQDGHAVSHEDGSLAVDGDLSLLDACDVVIIPSLWTPSALTIKDNRALIDRLTALPDDKLVVTLCTGAYLLAASGRLNERQATTHWFIADGFQADYPRVSVQAAANLTHDGNFICSGGAMAAVDACIYVVQLLSGRGAAKHLARLLVTDVSRASQAFYAPLYALRQHTDRSVRALEAFIDAHHAKSLTLDDLAAQIHTSVRTLQRRFQMATGMTPIQYQQMVRIERSKELLEARNDAVQEIALQVGYQDRAAFGRLFKKLTGLTPDAYRQRYVAAR